MNIRLQRLKNGWSQEQLAEMAGLSTRTVQRIERGAKASPETLKCLAAVLDTDFTTLQETQTMQPTAQMTQSETAEQDALEYVRDIKAFYNHLFTVAGVIVALSVLNLVITPGYFWVKWVLFGWGIGVASHAVNTFEVINILSPDWERRQVEKRLNKHR